MKINYKTGKLPPNFLVFGAMLIAVGVWRMIVLDWIGILLFIVGLVLFFLKSGIIIDAESKRLKKYIGFFGIIRGEWESIDGLEHLKIVESKAIQTMSVLSISRASTNKVCKLFMILPDKKIELMSGEKDFILKRAEHISSALHTVILNRTK